MKSENRHPGRELDLVLFGATGFTGRLVAEYLAAKRPSLKWALAGRSRERLEAVRTELAAFDPACAELPIRLGDSFDRASLDAIASSTRVVCTTVGPYARFGRELVAACAENGTDYCDLTGETPFIRAMIDAHHDRAAATGARIVNCCGFDSIPSDLGVLLLHEELAARGKQLAEAHFRIEKIRGGASGGSVASLLLLAERIGDPAKRRALGDPYVLNPAGVPRGRDGSDQHGPRRDPESGRFTGPFVMAAINTRIVRRSNALLDFPYGEGFRYDEAIDCGEGPLGFARALGLSVGSAAFLAAAIYPPTRRLLERVVPAPGEGPSRHQRENGCFVAVLHGIATDGERLRARVAASQDPGYGATSRMLAEAALSLAEDALPLRGGLLTPASCMGLKLVDRLRGAGMTFAIEQESTGK